MIKTAVKSGIPTRSKNQPLVEKRRQQIFEAAVKLFSRKGYHKTTLREISRKSGITLGSLYDYIRTKEDILYIIQEAACQKLKKTIFQNEEHHDPIEKLSKLISSELDAMDMYQDLIMIIYQESHSMPKRILCSLLASERDHIEEYEGIIREGIDRGVFKPTNVRMLGNMIKVLIDGWVIKRWDLRGKVTIEEMRNGILDTVFDGIVAKTHKRHHKWKFP
jgi:AcrR family transcriptional regulator